MFVCASRQSQWFCSAFLTLLVLSGCSKAPDSNSVSRSDDSEPAALTPPMPEAALSKYKFEPAVRVEAAGRPITVPKPGYACPTLFDLDGDGAEDLIVGQYDGGQMKWYRNLSSPSDPPKYAEGKWINCNDAPAEVPGIS